MKKTGRDLPADVAHRIAQYLLSYGYIFSEPPEPFFQDKPKNLYYFADQETLLKCKPFLIITVFRANNLISNDDGNLLIG